MKQSEFKKQYDPELGRCTRQHIYGEGVIDVFKNIGVKVFGQTLAKAAKTAANKAITNAATKTGELVIILLILLYYYIIIILINY